MIKKELIQELFQKFEQARYVYNEVECWSARELQEILGIYIGYIMEMIQEVDQDNDGKLSLEEFENAMFENKIEIKLQNQQKRRRLKQ